MENNIYDLAILGAGPAGICAAIYATRAKLNTIWLDRKFVQGGQIVDTYEVDNYPGLPGITGLDLGEAMAGHAEKLGLKPKREPVLSVTDEGEIKVIRTKKNEYHARAVIIACGATHRHLGIPGEEELGGMGVSYCATCDAAFFRFFFPGLARKFIWYTDVMNFVRKKFFRTAYLPAIMLNWCGTVYRYLWKVRTK